MPELNAQPRKSLTAGPLVLVLLLTVGLLHCDSSSDKSNQPLPNQPAAKDYNLEAQFDGRYVKGIRIEEGDWAPIGPRQDVEMEFAATGMSGIGQFELILELDPAEAFTIAGFTFKPVDPFVTLLGGVEPISSDQVRIGGADLTRGTAGDAELGTLTLRTSSSFSTLQEAHVRIVLFSMGPDSQNRDSYAAEQLDMGIVINQELLSSP